MKKNLLLVIKIMKLIVIIIGIIMGIYIAFYPFERHDLTLRFITENGAIDKKIFVSELQKIMIMSDNGNEEQLSTIDILWDEMGGQELIRIEIFRGFKSVCIAKITTANIVNYGYISEEGMHFNQEGCKRLYNYSSSLFAERLIFEEILFTVGIFLWIVINAFKEKIDEDNRDNHGPIYEIKKFFVNLIQYRQYMIYAAKADLKAEVANSYLNRLWWILEPFCNMLVYVVVFSGVMGSSIDNYAVYVFSGLILWNFFSHTINYSVKCVRNNRDIVTKIYVPKYVLLITNMILNFIKLLFSLFVLIAMMILFRVHFSWSFLCIIPVYAIVILLSFSIGMIFLHYGVFIDDLGYAVGILLSMLMFLSGTFYEVITTLNEPLNYILLVLNPIAMLIDTMREALFNNSLTNIPLMVVWFALSSIIGYIGVHIVNKNENGYVKVI